LPPRAPRAVLPPRPPPQAHGVERLALCPKRAVPDQEPVPKPADLPEVGVDPNAAAGAATDLSRMDQAPTTEIPDLLDRGSPVGEDGQQASPPLPDGVVPVADTFHLK